MDGIELAGTTTRPAIVTVNAETDQDADLLGWRRAFTAGLPTDPLGGGAGVDVDFLIEAQGLDGSAARRVTVRLEP